MWLASHQDVPVFCANGFAARAAALFPVMSHVLISLKWLVKQAFERELNNEMMARMSCKS